MTTARRKEPSGPSAVVGGAHRWFTARLLPLLYASLLLLTVVNTKASAVPVEKGALVPPVVIAHRGASGYAPEETQLAYEMAASMGADFLEADIVPTSDGRLVVRHDMDLASSTDIAGRPEFASRKTRECYPSIYTDGDECVTSWFVHRFTWAELQTVRSTQRIASRNHSLDGQLPVLDMEGLLSVSLNERAATGRNVGVYLESKHPSYYRSLGFTVEEGMVAQLEARGFVSPPSDSGDGTRTMLLPFILQSFELESLRRFSSLGIPAGNLVLLMDTEVRDPSTSMMYEEYVSDCGLRKVAEVAGGVGPFKEFVYPLDPATNYTHTMPLPTSLVSRAHALGLFVHAWTFRSDPQFQLEQYLTPADEYQLFLDAGLDGMFSDFCDQALSVRNAFLARDFVAYTLPDPRDRAAVGACVSRDDALPPVGIAFVAIAGASLVALVVAIARRWHQRPKGRGYVPAPDDRRLGARGAVAMMPLPAASTPVPTVLLAVPSDDSPHADTEHV